MLEITKEFRKGILFVRLKGVLNKDTVSYLNKEVTKVVADMQFQNVLFNVEELTSIDIEGVHAILYNYNLCKDNNGISLLCGVNKSIKNIINHNLSFIFQIKDEEKAINMVEI
nr:STAS domain-containing protein [Bacilli bacterium]